ncbi:nuclear transport factor 2 family protein [Nocardia asiatica]|uniref:nuclear transport factor 2 family protein n=1 Tax=Nocardia asiatica TaxID=209252 RepID=UPI003EDEE938
MTMTVMVQYRTHAATAEENQRLIEDVFVQLHRERPAGLRYTAYRLDDDATFVHVADDERDGASLTELTAFAEFQRDIRSRVQEAPRSARATVVGSYPAPGAGQAAVVVAVAFVEAFGKRDMSAVSALLADDVLFQSPRVRITNATDVLAAITDFAQAVTGVDIIDAFGDDERAVVVYDMHTGPFGTLRTVDHVVVRHGRILADTVVFDTRRLGA